MNLEEKKLSSRLIYDGRIVHLYEDTVLLPCGTEAPREYVKHNPGKTWYYILMFTALNVAFLVLLTAFALIMK